jgi:hypothetical protein
MIKSINSDQHSILSAILKLNDLERFDADITYGNGSFYKQIERPRYCFDIQPLQKHVVQACASNLPICDSTLKSLVFDPPFLTYIKQGREHNSIMAKRFSGFWSYKDLEKFYISAIKESHRVLRKKGIFIIKCQDIIHNHKMHCTHANILEWAKDLFRLKDLFVLTAKSRMGIASHRKQQHARIFHSYFLVLEKL